MRAAGVFAALASAGNAVLAQAPARDAAQTYPSRPIRWIVPFPPGGAADIVSRAIGQKLGERWGQQIVIDNRPGAGGSLGTEIAARATPDGYTVIVVPATFTTYPSLYRKLAYDPVRDFAPVTLVSSSALILVVHPAVAAKSVHELIALAKARPGQLNYASSGIGASAHLAAELFKSMVGVSIVHVPYKGQPPAMIDLISGQIHMMFPNVPVALPHVKAGKLRALAVTTLKRAASLPELPTMADSGLAGFEVNQWTGLVAPAGAPKSIIAKLHGEVVRALQQPDVHRTLSNHGFEPVGNTPQEFAAYIKAEIAKWGKVIKEAGIRAE
ncbi:MAG: tripartite tricarboxylate transporter substrate binding protein [Betaproteobacteria bacterium]|nr:tripartite tricarboxylate transporter substrate binding protein [Betaproteobacteria bacterium]MBI3935813.1 tripartite tricarboxylate transporter substrate binding protein [Betaproteobacteria bacterium]